MYKVAETKTKTSSVRPVAIYRHGIQRKIKVGKANDSYEQEANRVADRVVSMPAAAVQRKCAACDAEEKAQQKPIAAGITPLVQRQEGEEEEVQASRLQRQEEEKEEVQPMRLQRQEEEEEEVQPKLQRQVEEEEVQPKLQRQPEEEEEVQTKRFSGAPSVSRSVESTLKGSKSGGQAMDPNTRNFMESRFGTDFSGVKIHTDGQAVQMNKQLNAQAFTHGNHVYFNAGKYSPESSSGKHLLAHELTHTVQQGPTNMVQMERYRYSRKCGVIDWGHANPSLASDYIDAISVASNYLKLTGHRYIDIPLRTMESAALGIPVSSVKFTIRILKPLRRDEIEGIALAIYELTSLQFEKVQEWTDFISGSAWSEEDLTSNLIGFYRAAKGYSKSDIVTICNALSEHDSEEKMDDYDFGKSRDFTTSNWPSELNSIYLYKPDGVIWDLVSMTYQGGGMPVTIKFKRDFGMCMIPDKEHYSGKGW